MKSIFLISISVLVSFNQKCCGQGGTINSHLMSYEVGPCEDQFDHYDEKVLSYDLEYINDSLVVRIALNAACNLKLRVSEKEQVGDTMRLGLSREGDPGDCYCIYPIKLVISSFSKEHVARIYLGNYPIVID